MKLLMTFFLVPIVILISRCNHSEDDIYKIVPLRSSLSRDILTKSKQIIPNGKELILVYDVSDSWEYFDPHLLFFDTTLKLYAATYLPANRVDSVNSDTIYAILNEDKDLRKSRFRQDLPPTYQFEFSRSNSVKRSGRKSDKLIERIELSGDSLSIILYLKVSQNPYSGLNILKSRNQSTSFEEFTVSDTLAFPIRKFHFHYDSNSMSTVFIDSNGYLINDIMIVKTKSIYDDFYNQILARFGSS